MKKYLEIAVVTVLTMTLVNRVAFASNIVNNK